MIEKLLWKSICFSLLALAANYSFAREWKMMFPVLQENRVIAEILLTTDGSKIISLPSHELVSSLNDYVSTEVKSLITKSEFVTPEQLLEHGVSLVLNTQSMNVDMELISSARPMRKLNIDNSEESNLPYSEAAFWSWQNNFSFGYQYNDRTRVEQSSVDWLGAANVGGERGINATYSFYLESNEDTDIYRTGSQFFYDHVNAPWRIALGDIEPETSGHLPSVNIGGVSWERSYSQIQPYRQLRNIGTQQIELDESAEVTIFVNDIRITRLRLPPGRYEVDDLPLANGANDIRLDIQYNSGRFDSITYSQFYNGRLLQKGISDFSLSLGVESREVDNELDYEDKPILTGYYEFGLDDSWTIGGNGLSHQDGQLLGASIVNGSRLGNVTLRTSTSYSLVLNEKKGYAISLDYSQQIFGSSSFGAPNFRLSLEWQDNFSSTPWIQDNSYTYNGVSADYLYVISEQWDASIYTTYREDKIQGRKHNTSLQLNWRNQYWRVGLRNEYNVAENDEYKAYFTVEFFYTLFSNRNRLRASYNSDLRQSRLEIRKSSENLVGDIGYQLSAEERKGDQVFLAASEYTANRWKGVIELENRQFNEDEAMSAAYVNVSTSVVIADGHFGWGRAGIGSNALIDVHSTLNSSHVNINPNTELEAESIATTFAGNLVSLTREHQNNTITYTVPDAPLGYSLGAGIEHIKPGSLTTHIVTIGSDNARTLIATAKDSLGEPIALYSGVAIDGYGNRLTVFTNSSGRFVLDGVSTGVYTIIFGKWTGSVSISESSPILVYLEELIMSSKEDE